MVRNKVVEGAFINNKIGLNNNSAVILIGFGGFKYFYLDKSSIRNYHILTEKESYDIAAGLAGGFVGNFLFGPIGMVAGALSAKDSGNLILIEFVDDQKSMIEVTGTIARAIIQKCSSLDIPQHSDNIICVNCNKTNSNNSKFCIECGSKLTTATLNNQDHLEQQEYKPIPIKIHTLSLCLFIIFLLIVCFYIFLISNS